MMESNSQSNLTYMLDSSILIVLHLWRNNNRNTLYYTSSYCIKGRSIWLQIEFTHILVAVTKFISTVLTIPGGCVLLASVAVSGGGGERRCLCYLSIVCLWVKRDVYHTPFHQTPLSPHPLLNDSLTVVKTWPCPNFACRAVKVRI